MDANSVGQGALPGNYPGVESSPKCRLPRSSAYPAACRRVWRSGDRRSL